MTTRGRYRRKSRLHASCAYGPAPIQLPNEFSEGATAKTLYAACCLDSCKGGAVSPCGRRITVTVTTRFRAECVAKLRLRLSAKAWDCRPRTAHSAAVSCWVVRLGTAVRKMICKVFRQNTCGAVDVIRDHSSVIRGPGISCQSIAVALIVAG